MVPVGRNQHSKKSHIIPAVKYPRTTYLPQKPRCPCNSALVVDQTASTDLCRIILDTWRQQRRPPISTSPNYFPEAHIPPYLPGSACMNPYNPLCPGMPGLIQFLGFAIDLPGLLVRCLQDSPGKYCQVQGLGVKGLGV